MEILKIPVNLEYDTESPYTRAEMYSVGDRFVIETHAYSNLLNKQGWRQEAFDTGYKEGISYTELVRFLPDISSTLGENLAIESTNEPVCVKGKTAADKGSSVSISYSVKLGVDTIYHCSTENGAGIFELRAEVIKLIAKLVYEYQESDFFNRNDVSE